MWTRVVALLMAFLVVFAGVAAGTERLFFEPNIILTAEQNFGPIATLDLNSDGRPDVATAFRLQFYENADGKGNFDPPGEVTDDPIEIGGIVSIQGKDLTGDGRDDILVVNSGVTALEKGVLRFENTFDAQYGDDFSTAVTIAPDTSASVAFAIDVDLDGQQDVVYANSTSVNVVLGSFSGVVWTPGQSMPSSGKVVAGDFDEDGDADLIISEAGGTFLRLNQGGVFGPPAAFAMEEGPYGGVTGPTPDFSYSDLETAYIDDDTLLDMVWTKESSPAQEGWLKNNGDGTFLVIAFEGSSDLVFMDVGAADLDGDGDMDWIGVERSEDVVVWLENLDGAGTFGPSSTIFSLFRLADVDFLVSDISGDGIPDLVFNDADRANFMWLEFAPPEAQSGTLRAVQPSIEVGLAFEVVLTFPNSTMDAYALRNMLSLLQTSASVQVGSNPVPFTLEPLEPGHPLADANMTTLTILATFVPTESAPHIFSVAYRGSVMLGSPAVFSLPLACDPGFFSDGTRCQRCPVNTFSSDPQATACVQCPARMSSSPASGSFLDCACPVGEWFGLSERVQGDSCVPCPQGAVCSGGFAPPVAAPGFFASPNTPAAFVACRRGGCSGNGTCAQGYSQTFMCSSCASGYYSSSPQKCTECTSSSQVGFAFLVIGIVVLAAAAAAFVAWSASRVHQTASDPVSSSKQTHILAFRVRTIPLSLSMIVTAYQLVGLIAEANFEWNSASKSMLSVFGVFNINVQALGSECALGSFHVAYLVSILLPLLALGLVIAGVVLAKFATFLAPFRNLGRVSVRTLFDSAVFTLAPIMYIPLSRSTFVLFDCVKLPNGDIVVEADNGVACFDSAWWGAFPLGFACALLYVIGVPAYFFSTLFVRRHKLFEPSTTSRFGALYRNWRRAFYWGEVANLVRRLLIVAAATFLSRHQTAQILIVLGILVSSLAALLRHQPFYVPLYNGIEARLTSCVIAIFLIGAASYSERYSTSTDTFLFVLTLLAILLLLGMSAHALAIDVYSLYRERSADFVAASERQKDLVAVISNELQDVEAGPELLHAAGEFLAVLDSASRGLEVHRSRSTARNSINLGEIEMDEV